MATAAAVAVNIPKREGKSMPKKPEKSILFSIPNPFDEEHPINRGWPHWTETLFFLLLVTSIIMAILSSDNVTITTDSDHALVASFGIWCATAVSLITMYYNYGLFDRKRNAESAEYLQQHVQDMVEYNEKLFSLKFDQEQIVEREKMRQEKAKLVNKQLTDVAQYLGGANKIVSMLNTGLDKFLKANMKSLEKQEEESRESQLNMIDRGLDRVSELLIFSFCGIDKDKNAVLEGEELLAFFKELQKYHLCQTKEAFFDHFPIGLDVECGDMSLLDKICASKSKGLKKDDFVAAVKGIIGDSDDDDDLTLVKDSDKQAFLKLLKTHKIVKSNEEYFDKLHAIDRYLILEGMNDRTAELKELARGVLLEYDQTLMKLSEKEAELKRTHPASGSVTKIELDNDVLDAAKRSDSRSSGLGKKSTK